MATYYDRYADFRSNNEIKPIPGITIPVLSSDKYVIFRKGQSRLDKLSNTYYNNPYSGWLIMQANPEYGGLEFNIPDNVSIRIPFPFESAVQSYISAVSNHKLLYGE